MPLPFHLTMRSSRCSLNSCARAAALLQSISATTLSRQTSRPAVTMLAIAFVRTLPAATSTRKRKPDASHLSMFKSSASFHGILLDRDGDTSEFGLSLTSFHEVFGYLSLVFVVCGGNEHERWIAFRKLGEMLLQRADL